MDKITEQDLANRGVKGLPDVPGLTTEEMQRKLEEIAREILIPKVNELVEGLNNANSNFLKAQIYEQALSLVGNTDTEVELYYTRDGRETIAIIPLSYYPSVTWDIDMKLFFFNYVNGTCYAHTSGGDTAQSYTLLYLQIYK